MHDNSDGSYTGRFRIPELHGHLLTHVLDQLTAPRRLCRNKTGDPIVDPSAPGHDGGHNYHQARGAALCELIEHLPTKGHPHHSLTEIIVTLDLSTLLAPPTDHPTKATADGPETLASLDAGLGGKEGGLERPCGLGTARLDGGIAITAGEARRLACNAGLIPAVLDGPSLPLDLGRSRRLHTKTQRRALALTHDTCAISGCQRPFAWCEIHHHHLSWAHGGHTNLANGLPLCAHHHRKAHDPDYHLRQQPDGDWTLHPIRPPRPVAATAGGQHPPPPGAPGPTASGRGWTHIPDSSALSGYG